MGALPKPASSEPDLVGAALTALLDFAETVPASDLVRVVDAVGALLGADSARLLVADYGLTSLRYLGAETADIEVTPPAMEGTLVGRVFSRGEPVVAGTKVLVAVSEGSERLGVLELIHQDWNDALASLLDRVVEILVLILISRRRYTDVLLRSRRTEVLSIAAEMQWGLLPPLSCATRAVSLRHPRAGLLHRRRLLRLRDQSRSGGVRHHRRRRARTSRGAHLSTVAINGLRNARREGHGLEAAYRETGDAIAAAFGCSAFATGQLGSLDTATGQLSWLNAGHPLPLLVRDGHVMHELSCRPSLPMGLGGPVAEVAVESLQPRDRVLFFTDGVIETRASDGVSFGTPRLVDLLLRATHQHMAPVETLRSLSAAVMAYADTGLSDDATLMMLEYHGT